MRKLTYITLFIIGLLLGTLLSYLVLQKVIASRGGMDMSGFVNNANQLLQQKEVIDPLICAKLAMDMGYKIDNMKLNFNLNQQLTPFDSGDQSAFYLLVYLKGYAFGLSHHYIDKKEQYQTIECDTRFPWLKKRPHSQQASIK
ncbi:hypothetical protein [Shewanella colwelliana]|uniref:hypothetical protein n=1 Tax=Shewanella colwelliana TaxID=23 RepID=UPI00048B5917|nr:hypothetical protein [Shewanella colwelliana]